MAEAVVNFLVKTLGDLLIQKGLLLYGVSDEVRSMQSELRGMLGFLQDADSKQRGSDERVKNWVRDIREVAYQAEDVIEAFVLQNEMRLRRNDFKGLIKRYAPIPNLLDRYNVGTEIKEIGTKVLAISHRRTIYGIVNIGECGEGSSISMDDSLQAWRSISPHLPSDIAVGFDNDMASIVAKLTDASIERRCAISIVGMGGLGKSTLAKMLYNSNEVRVNFDILAWAIVSRNHNITKLLKNILKQVMKQVKVLQSRKRLMKQVMGVVDNELETMEDQNELKLKLHEFLKDYKYLVVLDDVWRKEVWDQIKDAFPNVNNGSRVIFTTRFVNVAKFADPDTPHHQLPLLNDQHSWVLFLRKVYPTDLNSRNNCSNELKDVGQRFSKLCGGLPLALVVLGGLLSTKEKTPEVWSIILERMTWQSLEDGKKCLEILALSYNDLPYYLKACYLFLSSFPEDSYIPTSKLIRLWTAEGFVLPNGRKTMEETATDYLEDLIQRCLVQVTERRLDGTIRKLFIHDLLHEICISEARNDQFLNVYNDADHTTTYAGSRRVAIHTQIDGDSPPNSSCPNLHTLLCFHLSMTPYEMDLIFKGNMKLLRVIDLEGARRIRRLPKEISNMIHIRYLGLKGTSLKELPSSIGDLCNLQTLDIRDTSIVQLPKAFWRIQTLRHLHSDQLYPPKISGKHLQTLKLVGAGSWIKGDLAKLTNLRKLGINNLLASHGESLLNSLVKLLRLVSVCLSGDSIPREIITAFRFHSHLHVLELCGPLSTNQELPESHKFPMYLTKLVLDDSRLERDPMAMLEKLPHLRILILIDSAYIGREMACSVGGFPRLHHLEIKSLTHLEDWTMEGGAMPSLTHLAVKHCMKLNMLPEGLRDVTTLQQLVLREMTDEFHDRVREDSGQDWYKIQHVPSIINQ